MDIVVWVQETVFIHICFIVIYIGLLETGFMQVFYLGRAPRTKETLPDFLKWRRVTRSPLVFRGLTGSQRTPGFGASHARCCARSCTQRPGRGRTLALSRAGRTLPCARRLHASPCRDTKAVSRHQVASGSPRPCRDTDYGSRHRMPLSTANHVATPNCLTHVTT